MPARRGRLRPTNVRTLLLTAVMLCVTTARSASAAPGRVITVNSRAGASAAPAAISLHDALEQAARDPQDNIIRFDPATFRDTQTPIVLTDPLVFDSLRTGQDRLEGPPGQPPLQIDCFACADAGLILGGSARLQITNLHFRGGKQRVILLKDNANLSLEKAIVSDGVMPGIALFAQSSVRLTDVRLSGNRTHGVELHGQATGQLVNVELRGNGQSGIAGFDASSVSASDCRLESNGDWGIVLLDSSRAELTRCATRRARFANADISGYARLTARDCTFDESTRFGLFATGNATLVLQSTRVRHSGSRGIELQDRTRLELTDSHIESSADYGLILFGQAAATATGSSFTRNGAHGASLRSQSTGRFQNCSFMGNRYSGVGCLDGQDGGNVSVSRSTFRQNGMRPIYRGPLHLDPLVPTPLHINGHLVECLADPGAVIELYLDRAGEASQYHKTLRADAKGRFTVDCREIPDGWVLTASATVATGTSEFNVVGGTAPAPVLDALLGRTGPLSDESGEVNLDTLLRRWKPQTRVSFVVDPLPSGAVERYLRFLVGHVQDWTRGAVQAEVRFGQDEKPTPGSVVVPIRYVPADTPQLANRGGVTFMKWDSAGYFVSPMEILLATARDPEESCPRVMAHEIGHALGLCHVRVGLLSRMQGSTPPSPAFVNDFSPMMTYYDVLALQILHDPGNTAGITLRGLVERGVIPQLGTPAMAASDTPLGEPTFSPPPQAVHDADRPASTPRP